MMASNLVDLSRSIFKADFLSKLSFELGENKENLTKAVNAIVPAIMVGISEKTLFDKSAIHILSLAEQSYRVNYEENLVSFIGLEGTYLVNGGKAALENLFGKPNVVSLTSIISNFSGINSASADALQGICTPLILNVLYRQLQNDNLSPEQAYTFIIGQKSNFSEAIPDGLNISGIFGTDSFDDDPHGRKKIVNISVGRVFLFVVFVFAVIASWIVFKNREKKRLTQFSTATEVIPISEEGLFEYEIGKIDSITGDIIYQQGEIVPIELPRYAGIITVGKRSTEFNLVELLSDSTKSLDKNAGNWICFSAILFKKGTAELTGNSYVQLKNLVSISKAYPTLKFEIAAYTDSTSDAAGNLSFSQKKADAVFAMLKRMGINPNSVSAVKGYGQKDPVANNSTINGRAQNRRVSIRVVSK
jgi:OOP family OmpA-OmpF porin